VPSDLIFLAPEIANDEENLDSRCDVYSFGALLYFLVTGGIADDSKTPLSCLDFKEEIWTNISKNLHQFIKICVNQNQKKRPSITDLRKNAFM